MSNTTPSRDDLRASLAALPSVDRVLAVLPPHGWPAPLVTDAVRQAINHARNRLRDGHVTSIAPDSLAAEALGALERRFRPTLQSVINATGVVLHTNLGRAPVSAATAQAMHDAAQGYVSVEYDLDSGERGSRADHLDQLLQAVTGAEAGIAVNNNAAALHLVMSQHCDGKSVAISRAQLVEIGGGFRIPDVIRDAGAQLREVGTTNRTRVADYDVDAHAILRVHSSNFRLIGFVEEPSIAELARLAQSRQQLLIDDIGSGCLVDTREYGLSEEPRPQESIAAGADLVLFSGDKLLGGPQAGVIVGKRDAIEPLRRHPLMRVLRLDKTAIAGLAATLRHYLRDEWRSEIPVWRMIAVEPDQLRQRAESWRSALGVGEVAASESTIGGGSLPGETRPTFVWSIPHEHPSQLAASLRQRNRPIIGRIEHDRLLLDPRTVDPADDAAVAMALRQALDVAP